MLEFQSAHLSIYLRNSSCIVIDMSTEVYFMCAGKDAKGLHFYVSFSINVVKIYTIVYKYN